MQTLLQYGPSTDQIICAYPDFYVCFAWAQIFTNIVQLSFQIDNYWSVALERIFHRVGVFTKEASPELLFISRKDGESTHKQGGLGDVLTGKESICYTAWAQQGLLFCFMH